MKTYFCFILLYVVLVVLTLIFTLLQKYLLAYHETPSQLPESLLLPIQSQKPILLFNQSATQFEFLHVSLPKDPYLNSVSGDLLVNGNWCNRSNPTTNNKLFLTPVEGFGNRIRAIVASHYIAFITGRELNIVWPDMEEFIQKSQTPPCVKWIKHIPKQKQKCTILNCHANVAKCIELFTTRSLQEIFPESETCIHLISFTAWELYLLDNSRTHGAFLSVTQKIPISVILNSFTTALDDHVRNAYKHMRARMSTSLDSRRHIKLTMHIRTGADRYDGGMIQNLYLPQLRCAAAIQNRLGQHNMSSSIFIETDSTKVKSIAKSMSSLSNAIFLDKHAERADLQFVIILWMLLGDGDVFLGSHGSSLSRTAAQRTGTTLYQLPVNSFFAMGTTNTNQKSLQCLESSPESTKTHDATFLLIPTECSEIYPACPGISVIDSIT